MADSTNPRAAKNLVNPHKAGEVIVNEFTFDFSDTSYAPTALADGDRVLIGYVPAGCTLVPHLSWMSLPAFEVDGIPTGDYTVGITGDADAVAATGAAETARVLSGEDFTAATAAVGSATEDVGIYAVFTQAVTDVTAVGVISAKLAVRAYNSQLDG